MRVLLCPWNRGGPHVDDQALSPESLSRLICHMPQVLPLVASKESWRLGSKFPAILSLLVFMSDSSFFLIHNF